jgi:hypothetical protein
MPRCRRSCARWCSNLGSCLPSGLQTVFLHAPFLLNSANHQHGPPARICRFSGPAMTKGCGAPLDTLGVSGASWPPSRIACHRSTGGDGRRAIPRGASFVGAQIPDEGVPLCPWAPGARKPAEVLGLRGAQAGAQGVPLCAPGGQVWMKGETLGLKPQTRGNPGLTGVARESQVRLVRL